jgi:hypothetical protein
VKEILMEEANVQPVASPVTVKYNGKEEGERGKTTGRDCVC